LETLAVSPPPPPPALPPARLKGAEDIFWIYDHNGKPRAWKIRQYYHANSSDISNEELIRAFETYATYDEFMILNRKVINKTSGEVEEEKEIAVKVIKRGNDKYCKKTYRKISNISKVMLEKVVIMHTLTNTLFLTLTFEQRGYDEDELYKIADKYFNVFITWLRKKFGRLIYIKSKEAHVSGFPHFHLVVIFLDTLFETTVWYSKEDGKPTIRLADENIRNEIKSCWKHGFVDIQAVRYPKDIHKYMSKVAFYVSKSVEHEDEKLLKKIKDKKLSQELIEELEKQNYKAKLSMAKAVALGLRLFAFSKYFNVRLDSPKNNSNCYLTVYGRENPNFMVIWEFIEIVSREELKQYYPELT
jgi:hypothetical protein